MLFLLCVSFFFISEVFLAGDIGQCHSHPQEAFFPGESGAMVVLGEQHAGGADGYYLCCKKPAYRCVCVSKNDTGSEVKKSVFDASTSIVHNLCQPGQSACALGRAEVVALRGWSSGFGIEQYGGIYVLVHPVFMCVKTIPATSSLHALMEVCARVP